MLGHYSILVDFLTAPLLSDRAKVSPLRSPWRVSVQDSLVIKTCRRPNRPLMTVRCCCTDLPPGRGARARSTPRISDLLLAPVCVDALMDRCVPGGHPVIFQILDRAYHRGGAGWRGSSLIRLSQRHSGRRSRGPADPTESRHSSVSVYKF